LQNWLDSGDLRPHRSSRQEIADLLAVAERDSADARVVEVSTDRRFAIAYSAALQLATIVVAASGYRVSARRGHHAVTFQALIEFMDEGVRELSQYLDSCRVLRNTSGYDRTGVVGEREVQELLIEVDAFRDLVLIWLRSAHRQLVPAESE